MPRWDAKGRQALEWQSPIPGDLARTVSDSAIVRVPTFRGLDHREARDDLP
jgi:hypothetical protein